MQEKEVQVRHREAERRETIAPHFLNASLCNFSVLTHTVVPA